MANAVMEYKCPTTFMFHYFDVCVLLIWLVLKRRLLGRSADESLLAVQAWAVTVDFSAGGKVAEGQGDADLSVILRNDSTSRPFR